MPRRVDAGRVLRWGAEATRIGGACLGVAIVLSSPAPEIVLPVVGVTLLLVGGSASNMASANAMAFRLLGPLLMVIAARILGGTAAAAIAALLVALGAWLRVRLREATVGLAVFAGAVAVLGGASLRILAAFWLLGAAIHAVRSMAANIRRRPSGGSCLKAERAPSESLTRES